MTLTKTQFAFVAALALGWRMLKMCVFEVLILTALIFSLVWDYPLGTWFWVVVVITSIPSFVAVWDRKTREIAYSMIRAKHVRITDIAMSSALMSVVFVLTCMLGPVWAAVVVFLEAGHHGAMVVMAAHHLVRMKEDQP